MTTRTPLAYERLYTPDEVARLLGVHPKTVTRWERQGKLTAFTRTPGGHRRYSKAYIDALAGGGAR